MANYYYITSSQYGSIGNAIIQMDDERSLSAAKKYGLTRANTCNTHCNPSVRYIGPVAQFQKFVTELG